MTDFYPIKTLSLNIVKQSVSSYYSLAFGIVVSFGHTRVAFPTSKQHWLRYGCYVIDTDNTKY